MVDREARDRTAELLRHWASGRISLEEFYDGVPRSHDPVIISHAVYECEMLVDAHELDIFETTGLDDVTAQDCYVRHLRLSEEERSELARTVMFLKSDGEYRWESTRLSWWAALLLAPVLCIGLFFMSAIWCAVADSMGLWLTALLSVVLALVVDAVYAKIVGRDGKVWPFFCRSDYEEALKHPKLLCGKKAA